MTPRTTEDSSRLAVLIDADNTTPRVLRVMLEELAGEGTVTVKRAYGDWTNPHLNGWKEHCLANGISPVQQFAYTTGKNATDSALIIDAMDLLYSGHVEGFALVSSDSDFTPLATRLRESGKRVIGVGQRKTPEAFRKACERFFEIEVLMDEGSSSEGVPREVDGTLQSMLTKALNKTATDDDDWSSLGSVGSHLNRTDPSFDPRTHGFAKLSDLVKAQPFLETKSVEATSGRSQLWVRPKRRQAAPVQKAVKKAAQKTPRKRAAKKAGDAGQDQAPG